MLRVVRPSAVLRRAAHTSLALRNYAAQPNARIDVDPGLAALLKDVDVSIARHKAGAAARTPRELEVLGDSQLTAAAPEQEDEPDGRDARKSPAARFGSDGPGAVVLPLELENAITKLIEGGEKGMLQLDAKRLFLTADGVGTGAAWSTDFDVRYKSRQQTSRHAERDGTAFAAVALPAHYAALVAVFSHIAHRLGPDWSVQRVIDWHAGSASGLWAAAAAFQKPGADPDHGPDLSRTTVSSYTAIERREALKSIGKRLLEDVDFGPLSASWHKMLPELPVAEGEGETLALSAFALSGLPSPLARKQLVREMWASGADTIVLIDHSGLAGFEAIAEARHMLLTLGRKELEVGMEVSDIEVEPPAATETAEAEAEASPSEDAGLPARTNPTGAPRPLGSYALAPCPHDGACPLYQPENRAHRLACGFSQRLQRPAFVRRTKRAGAGHEDVGYAYVVVRRGVRPVRTEDAVRRGRVGLVGRWEIEALEAKIRGAVPPAELQEVDGTAEPEALASADASVPVAADATPAPDGPLAAALRAEAHAWPRLVFPPLKRSGHVILDVCAPSGRIERATVPRSQGRQPYHDARKARWGDLFPHAPKNAPVVRHVPPDGRGPVRGADIGKRGGDVDADARRAREQTKARRKEAEKARKMEARAEKRKTKWEREGEDEDEDRD